MDRLCIIILILSLKSVILYGNDFVENDTLVNSFFKEIKNLNFEKSNNLTSKFKKTKTKDILNSISDIVYYRDNYPIQNQIKIDTVSDYLTNSLSFLTLGYRDLYINTNNSKSFYYFSKAHLNAKKTNYIELKKYCILSILEFHRQEILQSNTLYDKYIEEYSVIADQPIDWFWIKLYGVIFHTKSKKLDPKFFTLINELKKIEIKNKINSKLLSRFNIQKAYKFEILNQTDSASYVYKNIIKTNEGLPFNKHLVFKSLIRLSEIYSKKKKYQEALDAIEYSKKFLNKSDLAKSNFYILRYQSKNLEKLKRYEEAYSSLQKSLEIEYDLDYRRNTLQNSSLEIQLNTAEKEKQILIEQQQKKRNQNIAIGLGGSLFLGSIIAILVYRNTKRKQRIAEQEREIEIQKTEKLLKEQELTAIDAMISGQEKERQRLANDLHDNLGSALATVKLHFDHLKNNRNNPNIENVEELYSKTNNLLDEAYQKVRTIAHEKNSGVMANQGLLPAIKKLASKASNGDQLQIEVQDYGLDERLDNALEISIFRMIQELITNIIKHANATEINISLTNHDSLLNIIVEDNGKGFDAKVLPEKDGMGLKSIEKRVEHMEGTFEIDSTIGKGTNIIINIPI